MRAAAHVPPRMLRNENNDGIGGGGGRHCPFLNREDPRCAAHLGVNRLQQAFAHCAGRYDQCPTYRALLHERQHDRNGAAMPSRVAEVIRYDGRVVVTLPIPLTLRGRHVVRRNRCTLPLHSIGDGQDDDGRRPPTLGAA